MLNKLPFMNKKFEKIFFILGVFLVLIGFIPYLILREGSVLIAHDQFDGELLAYLFHAKYLGTGVELFPEWMGGVAKTALTPPTLLPILFYKILPPFWAFLWNQLVVAVTAFIGMYSFLYQLWEYFQKGEKAAIPYEKFLIMLLALCFSYLPFYSVYGLCVAGIPLLCYSFWKLTQQENIILNLLAVLFYGLMSSFVLVGYAVVGILFVYCLLLIIRKKKALWVIVATLGLTFYYIGTNLELVLQVLGKGGTVVSHKTELVLSPLPFWKTVGDLFFNGTGHAASYHKWMIVPLVLILFSCGIRYSKLNKVMRRQFLLLCSLVGSVVFIALFYGFYHMEPIVRLRGTIGGPAVYFQIDRIYWFYPFLWYTILAVLIVLLMEHYKEAVGKQKIFRGTVTVVCLLLAAGTVLWNSDFKKNIRQIVNPPTSNAVTFEKFFAEPVFEQIKAQIGKEQSAYRVGSIGLHPAAAAYNGFYTVDGYSNNYELSYKHLFRKVIGTELEKSPELKTYFDDWGNRCYLFSSELGMNFYFPKEAGVTVKKLEFDIDALKELGCDYLFSAVEIENAKQLGLVFQGRFETEEAGTYCIYLYSLKN